jgi:hypothetical protein
MISFLTDLDSRIICPSCAHRGLTTFYRVTSIPVQSNLLMKTRAEALAYPRGDLNLAICNNCGFITNTAFDPATQEHSTRYEATQGHSATFGAFAKSLAKTWVERYRLHGKTLLEIGCLNGEFIALLCSMADTSGIGIDPILDPARTPDTGGHVRFINDFYGEKYANLPADFICCRHTLEHIAKPQEFISMIRRTIGDRKDVVVCFEVPDVLRVLQEGAFWDLYYEHCSYFTPASLADLFRRCGFAILDDRREFDDQYLIIEAKPGVNSRGEGTHLVRPSDFKDACSAKIKLWNELLNSGKRIAIWGSGSKAVGFLTTLAISHDAVPYVVDINPNKHGTYLPGTGQEIVSPQKLVEYQPQVVIAMNPIYRREIQADLDRMNVGAELLAL